MSCSMLVKLKQQPLDLESSILPMSHCAPHRDGLLNLVINDSVLKKYNIVEVGSDSKQ